MNSLLSMSGIELAASLRAGKMTSIEVVEAHIRRAEEANPFLNAIVVDRFEQARQEARAADQRLAQVGGEELPPFHGVPCTIKECFALEGMPQTSGLLARVGPMATTDAPVVRRMRSAGAIPIGVTNTSELCMWMESSNPVYGRTRNPYDQRRVAGGSSGGEGAIVGAGASPFGLGSDIGGSIRMPAFFNGVFGHKPSAGLVPNTGQYPAAENAARWYLCTGPIARRAADLMPLLRVMAGPDGADQACEQMDIADEKAVSFEGRTVWVLSGNGRQRVHRTMRHAQARAAEHLGRLGASIKDLEEPRLRYAYEIWSSMMFLAAETPFVDLLGGGQPIPRLRELARWTRRRSRHTIPALLLALLEQTPSFPSGRAERFHAMGEELRRELDHLLADGSLLLFPSYPRTAPRHGFPLLAPLGFVYTGILNTSFLPSTQVPLGLDRRGLPLGVQVAARRGSDHLTIAAACELERAFGGWRFPRLPGTRN